MVRRVAVWMFAGETLEECEHYIGRKQHVDFDCYTPIFVEPKKGETNRQAALRAIRDILNITIPYGYDLKYVQ